MIDGNYHLVKYSWLHAFTRIIKCDKCNNAFKLNEIIYKHFKRVDGIIITYYFCLSCAGELKLKNAPH